jgi:hypothetical protein
MAEDPNCVDCTNWLVGTNQPPVLDRFYETDFAGVFRFGAGIDSWGVCNQTMFQVPAHATARSMAVDVLKDLQRFRRCAYVQIVMLFRSEEYTVYSGAPVRMGLDEVVRGIRRCCYMRAVHPRMVNTKIQTYCWFAFRDVIHIRKSELEHFNVLVVSELPTTDEAKRLANQVSCWFNSDSNVVLARHFLVGLLVAHLFDDLRCMMQVYPEFCTDFFLNFRFPQLTTVSLSRFVVCPKATWLFVDPELEPTHHHLRGHLHRMTAELLGTVERIDGWVKPEQLPLEIVLRLQNDGGCPVIRSRRCHVSIRLVQCVATLAGRLRIIRKRHQAALHEKFKPMSAGYFESEKRFHDFKNRMLAENILSGRGEVLRGGTVSFHKRNLHYGHEDLHRANRRRNRRLKLRYLVKTGKEFVSC